jgi:hypothetical protein
MRNFNMKQKMNTVLDHVKTHPTAYAVGLALTASTIARYVYDRQHGMVHLTEVAKDMAETGKGAYFKNAKTGVIIIATLYNPETMKDLKFLD